MPRIKHPTAVVSRPANGTITGVEGYFTAGDGISVAPTQITQPWANWVQESIMYAIVTAGLTGSDDFDTFSTFTNALTQLASANAPLPNGYINAPVPTFDIASPRRVNFNGELTARSRDNTANITLASASRNLDLATNGANGLADGLTVANNTWYYVYAYSGGYVASTASGASTLTISTVSQKVVQLPLTLRTDGSANILPFKITKWNGRFSELLYDVTYDFLPSPATGATRISSAFANTSFTSVSASSFVPPITRSANFILKSTNGVGQITFAHREASGKAEMQAYVASASSPAINRLFDASLTSSQALEFKVGSGSMDIFVTGYTVIL